MDADQCNTLGTVAAALAQVPDPRARRGRRYEWGVLLALIVAGLASGQATPSAIGQWVREHAVMDGVLHFVAPLLANVIAEKAGLDWERLSARQRLGYLGRAGGAVAVDVGKWTLGPGGAGIVTALEHVAASGTIALRKRE